MLACRKGSAPVGLDTASGWLPAVWHLACPPPAEAKTCSTGSWFRGIDIDATCTRWNGSCNCFLSFLSKVSSCFVIFVVSVFLFRKLCPSRDWSMDDFPRCQTASKHPSALTGILKDVAVNKQDGRGLGGPLRVIASSGGSYRTKIINFELIHLLSTASSSS